MKTLTIFTPTFNRKHTIQRTYDSLCRQTSSDFDWLIVDDGSSDGTREWVESLGEKILNEGDSFDWMGCPLSSKDRNHFVVIPPKSQTNCLFSIEYIFKPNGGLFTGYNTAYKLIQTELCVCIDSDDYLPDDAVQRIITHWMNRSCICSQLSELFCGLVGLDYNVVNRKPIGGFFPSDVKYGYLDDLKHRGDSKQVMRTALMKKVSPQIGFKGEKDFNPYYMLMEVCDKYPIIVVNENFCWVEYQTNGDSMSAGIWKQYLRSPKSYAKYRIMQLQMRHGNNIKRKMQLCIHYVSSCILSHDRDWLRNSPCKLMTFFVAPLGIIFTWVVKYKNR